MYCVAANEAISNAKKGHHGSTIPVKMRSFAKKMEEPSGNPFMYSRFLFLNTRDLESNHYTKKNAVWLAHLEICSGHRRSTFLSDYS